MYMCVTKYLHVMYMYVTKYMYVYVMYKCTCVQQNTCMYMYMYLCVTKHVHVHVCGKSERVILIFHNYTYCRQSCDSVDKIIIVIHMY